MKNKSHFLINAIVITLKHYIDFRKEKNLILNNFCNWTYTVLIAFKANNAVFQQIENLPLKFVNVNRRNPCDVQFNYRLFGLRVCLNIGGIKRGRISFSCPLQRRKLGPNFRVWLIRWSKLVRFEVGHPVAARYKEDNWVKIFRECTKMQQSLVDKI